MNELSTNLGTVFLMRLACGNLVEVAIPILKVNTKYVCNGRGQNRPGCLQNFGMLSTPEVSYNGLWATGWCFFSTVWLRHNFTCAAFMNRAFFFPVPVDLRRMEVLPTAAVQCKCGIS